MRCSPDVSVLAHDDMIFAADAGGLKDVEATLADPTTFWMAFEDFARAFNRFYITRLFPPAWHQLTLHSGSHQPSMCQRAAVH